jgi:hypothetical protein
MNLLAIAISNHNGLRIAEVGFLLGAIAGTLLALAAILNLGKVWTFLAGIGLATGSVLLIVATHWGHFGHL